MFGMRRIIWLWAVMTLCLSLLLVSGCSEGQAVPTGTTDTSGNAAPDFRLKDIDGQEVSLSDFRGKPVLLNFWATWCGPCRSEMPYLQGIYEDAEFKDRGLVVLAINIQESHEAVAEFMQANSLSFPVLLDEAGEAAGLYNVRGIPSTFFIDDAGEMVESKVGAFSSQAEIEWYLVNSIIADE